MLLSLTVNFLLQFAILPYFSSEKLFDSILKSGKERIYSISLKVKFYVIFASTASLDVKILIFSKNFKRFHPKLIRKACHSFFIKDSPFPCIIADVSLSQQSPMDAVAPEPP